MPPRKLYLASTLGQFIPVVWLGVLGATLATTNGSVDPGKLIVSNFGALALPVLFLVIHGPIATNILNIYTFSVAAQALDIKVHRRKLNLFVGVFALAAVIFFIFQSSLATVLEHLAGRDRRLDRELGGHHAGALLRHREAATRMRSGCSTRSVAGDCPTSTGPPMVCFVAGIVATWMFMYGPIGVMQGFGSRALGGLDLSWLAGGLVAAALYAVLGPRAHQPLRRCGRCHPRIPDRRAVARCATAARHRRLRPTSPGQRAIGPRPPSPSTSMPNPVCWHTIRAPRHGCR